MIRDLEIFPQDALAYCPAGQREIPLLSPERQRELLPDLRRRLFAPWGSSGDPAITVAHASLREEPTLQPRWSDPSFPGGGPPFDTLQSTTLWPGTPLAVQQRTDGWARVSTPLGEGWLMESALARCDEDFVARWTGLPLAAVTRERTGFSDLRSRGELGIGALLPIHGQDARTTRLLLPVSAAGEARALPLELPSPDAALLPLPMTPANLARLANQMLGQSYGWGGVDASGRPGLRDCSSTTHDLYTAFGLWLPRNSAEQAAAGRVVPLAGLSPAQKEEKILREGVPWLTLLRSPGHIMIYVGSFQGRAAMLHNFWGVRIKKSPSMTEGRGVIAQCAVTSLAPGAELPDILPGGTYLEMMESMVMLS